MLTLQVAYNQINRRCTTELKGYRRPDGRVGFRNHVLILPTVACSYSVTQKICSSVPGTITLPIDSGCAMLKEDIELYSDTLVNLAGNPNVAATLVVGLGCEAITAEQAAARIEKFKKPMRYLSIQQVGGTLRTIEEGIRLAQQLVEEASTLEPGPASVADLMVGLNCGGSDPASGLTANTALGVAVDRVVDQGGTAIIGETAECVGAEEAMVQNAATEEVGKRILEVVKRFEEHVKMYGADLSTGEPNQGNREAGLTTIEEKSLGCMRKIGSRPIVEMVEYGQIPTKKGPLFMDSPSYDAPSIAGMVAGGCQTIVFTTGLGTPFGISVSPVIKVTSNTPAYERMKDNTDINAGTILEGRESIGEVGERIYQMILGVANGRKTKAEELGENQCQIWRRTVVL